ncbi:DUF4157 domain-containing protein (plasmid) [Haloferax sp. S1W]|uniref:DUF4157 domain-containing protein n=1 Tax=Haloferax sp. S1W TaxID=3377110 RepID=UPI0037C6BC2E
MGFRTARESTAETERSSVWNRDEADSSRHRRRQRGPRLSVTECEDLFGLDMYRDGLEVKVQRLVQSHGAGQVRQWADEGMTVETMGKPRDMRQFRERQDERPAEVPKDIERRNAKSVQRSRNAHHEASKAGDAQVPDSVRDVISSPGQHLDSSIQQAIEERMGDSLGDVRIHTGPQAAKACEDINARAFTVGNHIAFNHGEYDPNSAEGQHVLAHELAHVRQQTGGAVSMLPQTGELEIDPDERLEREAEETAKRVMRGGELGIFRMRHSDVHVQRMGEGEYIDGASIGGMIEAIASESELEPDEVAAIVENYKVSGTVHSGAKGHDALNLKALKEAQNLLEEADIASNINQELLAELEDSDLRADLAISEMKADRGRTNSDGLEHFDSPDETFETVKELQNDQEKLEQRLSELDNRLKQTIGRSNIRLSDKQKEALKNLADQIDSPYSGQAVSILLNYMSVASAEKTLSGILATAASTGPMGGVILAMGVVSTITTILPQVVSMLENGLVNSTDEDTTGSATDKTDF